MSVIQLTQNLIAIPSYLGERTDERAIGEFVFRYLKQFSFLKVEKQKVSSGRFNIVARTNGRPRLFLAGHLDTVEPRQSWLKNQFGGLIEDSRLFGLGALDMKSGVAAILDSLKDFEQVSGLTLLFYCDEEYDFLGMRKFVDAYEGKEIGDLAVLAEPTDLKIWDAHRGIIEISFAVEGKTGHAADLRSGRNAIVGVMGVLNDLQTWLGDFKDPVLGTPSMNIAYLRGGLNLGKKSESETLVGKQGNNIADFAEAVIDIRPTRTGLCAEKVIAQIRKLLEERKLLLRKCSIRHDFGSLYTDPREAEVLEKVVERVIGKVGYLDPVTRGYGDGQLLQEEFGVPVVYLGPKGENAHGADEWVDVHSLKKLREIYSILIKEYCR